MTEYPSPDLLPYDREDNPVYPLVEKALMLLSPDEPENPLSGIINPGDSVVIKPNFCTVANYPLPVTHPSVLVPIVDYAVKAGASKITLAEGPIDYRHGLLIFRRPYANIKDLVSFLRAKYPSVEISFKDTNFDRFRWIILGEHSELRRYKPEKLYRPGFKKVTEDVFYYARDVRGFSPEGYRIGCYAIAQTFLDCDCFISVPKLKTHEVTGITIALKNMMGLNRSWMGDVLRDRVKEFPREWEESLHTRDVPHFGILEGEIEDVLNSPQAARFLNFENDVLWRSLADLNKIVLYADGEGRLHPEPQRRLLIVVDGIVGGEGEGPTSVSPKASGVIVAGHDPVGVDGVCLRVMGWNPDVIRLVTNCSHVEDHPVGRMVSLEESLVGQEPDSEVFGGFYLPPRTYSDDVIAPYSVRG